MSRGRYNVQDARSWYRDGRNEFNHDPLTSLRPNLDVDVFVMTLLRLLLPNSGIRLPDTFNFDAARLHVLKEDLDAVICESICCDILDQLVGKNGKILFYYSKVHLQKRPPIASHHSFRQKSSQIEHWID
jgi:hypothetical protein